ncbi:hypothetical protein BN7_5373 [Wickerhamomyces ciferrii]|uniref:Endoplasmic reticulum lectin n=1 Tax=Wickerhamomyces ciferrii (strain ATCC 14091 / BCRC 22168 / CBS 111 / JCM 3599 / NBRC 0793 / NRRL Y-1031 F-60-10) TaxID=1206466 RepID=K0KV71_WICCF|nr:uncharacterized protein BN7_5373 [Wickerhamomyces ciferrii]CCH45787.1 hypothetical protein BN7_5373 [Wickerhamomyces ciferrii]
MQSSNTDYMCHIPQVSSNNQHDPFATIEEESRSEKIKTAVKQIKETLENAWLFHNSGYWSFGFKFGQELSQFHGKEKDFLENKNVRYILGVPNKSDNYNDYSLHKEGGVWFLRYNLKGGTTCDLTGRPRTAEIQFMCDPSHVDPSLNWVKEYKSCQYHAQISIPQLCSDDLFGMNKEEIIHEIECTKVIDQDTEFIEKDKLIQKSFTDHDDKISIEDYELESIGNGIFLGKPTNQNKTNIFITNSEDINNELLGKLSSAYAKGLVTSKIKIPVTPGSPVGTSQIAKLLYETYVYNVRGEYLTTVQIQWRENGQLVTYNREGLSLLKHNFKKIVSEDENGVVSSSLDDNSNNNPEEKVVDHAKNEENEENKGNEGVESNEGVDGKADEKTSDEYKETVIEVEVLDDGDVSNEPEEQTIVHDEL